MPKRSDDAEEKPKALTTYTIKLNDAQMEKLRVQLRPQNVAPSAVAAASGDDIDIFAYFAEPPLIAVNLFHLRNGRIVDRREFYWEDQFDFQPAEFMAALVKQVYLDQQYVPSIIHVPAEFEDREALETLFAIARVAAYLLAGVSSGPDSARSAV